MLNTTLTEGRKLGPAGSYFQRCCEASSNSNLAWPRPAPTTSLASLQAPLPSALSPATRASAAGINLQLEAASLHYSASLKTRTRCEVTESLFAPGGYSTPPTSSPYLSASPYELATKDYHQSIAFSQANSIFVQSQTDFVTGTSSISKKTATCFGRWEHTLEPLHIQVPPFQSVSSLSVKTEGISCGSSQGSKFENLTPHSASHSHHLQSNGDCLNSCGFVTTMTTSSPQTTSIPSSNDISNGCSRTIPISWSSSSASSQNTAPSSTSALLGGGSGFSSPFPDNQNPQQQNAAASSTSSATSSSVTLLQIKREPCQVSEVTTSNNLGHQHHSHRSASSLTAVVKLESSSPKSTVMDNQSISASQNPASAIPVGIAVARQRLQEHTTVAHQPKESNRFGIGIADIGGATSAINSQNMFFAGTNSTMIPFNSDALNMGAPNVQNAVRTPPTFWQYPTPVPVESMLPMPIPPVGFQLVRDPNTGQFLFLPATTATIEPFQPAVVWPTYPQPTTAIQPPHLLLPPLTQSLQPPPLAPLQLLGSDYLATASTTLHQHTQTHSTRFVALTQDAKRKHVAGPTIPLPIPQHTVIKIEDCSSGSATAGGTSTTHHQSTIYDEEKTGASVHASAATITTAVQTNDVGGNMPAQLYYHQPPTGLIQIAPQHSQAPIQECRSVLGNTASPTLMVPPSLPTSSPKITTCLHSPNSEQAVPENLEAATSCVPEVQDATIQTDTPVMSEDDNTVGAEECSLPEPPDEIRDGVIHSTSLTQTLSSPVCHNAEEKIDCQESSQKETDLSKVDSGFDSNAVSSTMSVEEPQSSISEKWNCTNLNVRTENEAPNTRNTSPELNPEKELQFKGMGKVTSTPVDLSGLELLSNISIEAIEKKIEYIKQEPIEDKKIVLPDNSGVSTEENEVVDDKNIELASDKFVNHEQLGGLNLLCALAEQRIQEEVGQRHRKRSSSSSESYSSKKKKHKHSKSSKKSKHDKDKKEKKRNRKENEEEPKQENDNDEGLDNDIKETFKRVTAKYTKCTSCKDEMSHCCKEKCGWPTPEELMLAMETDMRLRLADITRQCQEKKKELEEMSPLLHQRKQHLSDGESTPLSSKSSVRSYHTEKQAVPSTSLSSTLLVPVDQNHDLEVSKASSDTESCRFDDVETSSVSSSKRKAGNPKKQDETSTEMMVSKKPKTLVSYIIASKNRSSTETIKDKNLSDNQGFLTDETTIFSESSCKANRVSDVKVEADIKEEPAEEDTTKQDLEKFSVPCEENSFFSTEKRFHRKSSKHHSKHKKSKSSRERKHREMEKRKMKIDSSCVLTFEHLDKGKTRVLTAMAGLFYAGTLSPVQPPDIYAVTLDGERNNKPHIMSREEVLRDAILEVSPTSIEDIPTGTRICAYWSQQYRCLYPGTVAEPGTPDIATDKKFVCVEFDDGDSGRIALEDIRFLLSDYPIVEYDPNPLLSLGKRKRRTSQNHTEITQKSEILACSSSNCFGLVDDKSKMKTTIEQSNSYKERKKLKKMKKERHKKSDLSDQNESAFEKKHKRKHKCNEEFCRHRKHKKRKKHKKHHRRENLQIADSSQDADFSQCNSPDAAASADSLTPAPPAQLEGGNPPDEADLGPSKDLKRESDEPTFDPNVKEDTMMEEEVASSTTESSGSIYEPKRKKERQNSADNHSKIAAFLPARQLWAWAGKGHKRSVKGRARKQFYRAIQRGKETILVGDSAVFLSTGRPDRPYIGKIESMWETSSSNKVVRVKWFYHPEETVGCPNLKYPGALFESPHADENDVQTISHKCEVLSLDAYTKKFGPDLKQYENIYDNNDTYYLAGYYDPTIQSLKLQPDIPTVSEGNWS